MLLDLGLPDFDGMQVIAKVRSWSQMPILVISARDQDTEKAATLDAGADDYLTKPFSATELMARIRVSLRHLYQAGMQKRKRIASVQGLKIDFDKRLVYLDEGELHVTPMEYTLLALFFHNIGKVLTNKIDHPGNLWQRLRNGYAGPARADGGTEAKDRTESGRAQVHPDGNRRRIPIDRRIKEATRF